VTTDAKRKAVIRSRSIRACNKESKLCHVCGVSGAEIHHIEYEPPMTIYLCKLHHKEEHLFRFMYRGMFFVCRVVYGVRYLSLSEALSGLIKGGLGLSPRDSGREIIQTRTTRFPTEILDAAEIFRSDAEQFARSL